MTIIRQGLLQLAAAVYPVEDVSLDPALAISARASSGDQYPTAQTVFGGVPQITCSMPIAAALDNIGLVGALISTLEMSLLKIDAATGRTASGDVHVRIGLATSCKAYAMITGFSASQGGIATAQVMIYGISNDGMTDPFDVSTAAALAISAQPTLHTLGPVDLNGAQITGAISVSGSLNNDASPRATDGDLYPTQYSWRGCSPILTVEHSDPDAVLSSLGMDGASITSSTKVTFRARGTTGVISATEKSITVGAGYVQSGAISGGVGRTASTGFTILSASTDGSTHPWTLGS